MEGEQVWGEKIKLVLDASNFQMTTRYTSFKSEIEVKTKDIHLRVNNLLMI